MDHPRTHPAPSLVPADPADAATIAALGFTVWTHTYASSGISAAAAHYVLSEFTEARARALIADPNRAVLVAKVEGELVGYAVVNFQAPFGDVQTEVETLYVHPPFARQGIGRGLLQLARRHARQRIENGAIWLSVNARNDRAIGFYLALGLVHEDETYFELEGARHKNWVMTARN